METDSFIDVRSTINELPYAADASYDPGKMCIPGTRKLALGKIHQWINQPDGDGTARLMILTGVAGVGKSALSRSIAQHYDELKRLGSFVSFNRTDQQTRHPGNLLSTISRHIADLDAQWKVALYETVKDQTS